MSKLLHLKASRTQVLDTFPSNSFGKDGDIVLSRIAGKGVYLCSKAGGIWYTANKMGELRKTGQISTNKISTNELSINRLSNATNNNDKFIVSDSNSLAYRTSEQVIDDLDIKIKDVEYKQAYCSLGQYTNKEDCEANNGTWYYSENDSHDSISSTAENELLTVASTLGKLDAEPTLLYDGSTLEIKRNTNYDDNWQTSAQDNLLKLTYDSSNNAIFGVNSSGDLTLDAVGDISLDAGGADINFQVGGTSYLSWQAGGNLIMRSPADTDDSVTLNIAANGAFQISTLDDTGAAGHIALNADGDVILDPNSGITKFYLAGDTDDLCTLTVAANGATTITTTDSDGAAGDLTLQPDGRIKFTVGDALESGIKMLCGGTNQFAEFWGEVDSHSTFKMYEMGGQSSDDYFKIQVDESAGTTIQTVDAGGTDGHITLDPDGDLIVSGADVKVDATKKIYLDGGSDTYIKEAAADIVRHYVGGDIMMQMEENGADGNTITFSSASVGFIQHEPTYDAGTTTVDFRHSNKQNLTFGAGNITHVQLIFPECSGNFQLLIKQDGTGSRTITGAYKVYEYDETPATGGSSVVVWAGGSAPTLTTDANHVDILSFYWDDDNQTCYGVATLDFQF